MKRPRLITRRRLKWAGTGLCVLVLGVGVASAWYEAGWWARKPSHSVYIGIFQGRLVIAVFHFDTPTNGGLPRSEWNPRASIDTRNGSMVFGMSKQSGPGISRIGGLRRFGPFHIRPVDSPWIDLRPDGIMPHRFGRVSTLSCAYLPLWLPLLLIAAPTAWLWRTDRRAKSWQCPKCRYDLRGLDGGVCPECGASVESC